MFVVVPICSFCERVRDEQGAKGDGRWMPMKEYQDKYGLLREEVWASHTECPSCSQQYEQFVARTRLTQAPVQMR